MPRSRKAESGGSHAVHHIQAAERGDVIMANRRAVHTQLTAGAVAVPAVALGTAGVPLPQAVSPPSSCDCPRPLGGPYADYFPNVVVHTHDNRKALFYNDLLRGKVVMMHCTSVADDAVYPVIDNLVSVQRLLGDRVGREVFMYSLTVDPEHDTPRVLRAFADRHGVGPGWLFLTGEPDVIHALRSRLFAHADGSHHTPVQDCALGLIRYGNEAVGLWGSVPAKTEPEWIVQRLSWVATRPLPVGPPRRRGPVALAAPSRSQG